MRRALLAVLALVPAAVLAAGCGGGSTPPEPDSTSPASIEAFPEPPHVDGPLPVRLQPALAAVGGDEPCAPGYGLLCLGERGYRALGAEQRATVARVSTAPNDDHTAWDTEVRFESPRPVRAAADGAAGMGGVVLILDPDGRVLAAVPPPDLEAGRAQFSSLEKAQAWALVEAFSRSAPGR